MQKKEFLLSGEWKDRLVNRFINYIKIPSSSQPEQEKIPSTEKQWKIAEYLKNELIEIGLEDVSLDENGYVMGFIPSNNGKNSPVIGFIAHYDTSPDFNGDNVNPLFWENYNGEDLLLNQQGFSLKVSEFPELKNYIGQTLITTDGNSLLGADDKAGVAEIVTAAEYLLQHSEIKHGRIAIAFTPDEEVGRGADLFDVKKFGADWAYTMDGGEIGELEFENFNAAGVKIKFTGRSVHPGSSKGKMVNATLLALEYASYLPVDETPSTTEGYEGFYHLTALKGNVENAELKYIIRDHDSNLFEKRKKFMLEVADKIKNKYGERISIDIKDQYYNMKGKIEDKMFIIERAEQAMKKSGITPIIKAIRGGTDGCRLSYMGLPCPNIFAGGLNFHGPYEFIPIESMQKATEVIVYIASGN